jgi:ElaB/YqjD/DUF883 family membrane-anchored ribosome-binding protein
MSNVNGNTEEVVVSNGNGLHKVGCVDATDTPNKFTEKLAEYGDRIVSGAHQAKDKISELGARVGEKAESVKVQASEFSNHAIKEAKYFGGEAGVQARTHPFLLLGVAVVAGALIARIGRG